MKTNYWLNQNRFLSHLRLATAMLLACSAALSIAAPSTSEPNDKNADQTFSGTVSGTIPPPSAWGPPLPGTNGCVFSFPVPNSGQSNLLGQFTGMATFMPNVCDNSYTGTYEWVAANGDRISGPFRGQLIATATPGVFNNFETATIANGTGRFRHASGQFTLYGTIDFNTSTFVLPWLGTASPNGH